MWRRTGRAGGPRHAHSRTAPSGPRGTSWWLSLQASPLPIQPVLSLFPLILLRGAWTQPALISPVAWGPASPRLSGDRARDPGAPPEDEILGLSSCRRFCKETKTPVTGGLLTVGGSVCCLCRQASWLGILTPPPPAVSHRSSRAPTAGAGLAEFLLVLEAPASWVSAGPSPRLCRQTPSRRVLSWTFPLCGLRQRERERAFPPVFPLPLSRTPVS